MELGFYTTACNTVHSLAALLNSKRPEINNDGQGWFWTMLNVNCYLQERYSSSVRIQIRIIYTSLTQLYPFKKGSLWAALWSNYYTRLLRLLATN